MNLVMAVSADGYAAKGPGDDMRWTGRDDKEAFRLLTYSASRLFAGIETQRAMPALRDRPVYPISRNVTLGCTLEYAAATWPEATLIGGPTVAEAAVRAGLIDRAFISVVPMVLMSGIRFDWMGLFGQSGQYDAAREVRLGQAVIGIFSRKGSGSC